MERLNACKYSHCTEPEVRTEEPEEQERRKSGKWHVATGHAQLRIVNHVYTATCSYNTMLFADPDCCTRTYVYILSRLFTSQPVSYTAVLNWVCEVPLISKVYDRYPKSMIISPGSSTGAQKAKKLSIFPTEPKGSKLLKHRKGKERVAHLQKGTTAGTTGLNKGLRKRVESE